MPIQHKTKRSRGSKRAVAAAGTLMLALGTPTLTSAKLHIRKTHHASLAEALVARQGNSQDLLNINNYMASNYKNGSAAPGARNSDSAGQYVVIGGEQGADDNSQVPSCPTIFIGGAAVKGSDDGGWEELPTVLGFDLKRDLTLSGNAVLPYFEERGKDPTKIKRVVLVQPGKPRDSWKYTNLMRNALICAAGKNMGVDLGSVLIAGPAWMDANDHAQGATQANDLWWKSTWAQGDLSGGPGDTTVSTFKAFDALVEKYFDRKTYPNLNNVVVAGHSLGASFTQRYAMMRNPTANDANLIFWMGNPGAYVWPTDQRPVMNNGTCPDKFNLWPYGLDDSNPSDIPVYGRKGFDKQKTLANYFGRQVHYNLGLLDNGPGDTHCEAQYEGPSHLARGVNLQKTLSSIPAAANHTFDFVPNTSHQDYKMFAADSSLKRLFVDGLNTRVATASSSGSGGGSSNGSSSSSAAASGANSSASAGKSGAIATIASPVSSVIALGITLLAGVGCALM